MRLPPEDPKAPHPEDLPPWLLLIHRLPAKPLYLRARIRHRLEQAGAVALKNAVYVLPERPGHLDNLASIAAEADAAGGEAHVCRAAFPDARTHSHLVRRFRSERAADYAAVSELLERWKNAAPQAGEIARQRRRFEEIQRIDFFQAPGRSRAASLLARAERRAKDQRPGGGGKSPGGVDRTARVWATRPGVQIDRIASAWLIRRFIDPEARFRFVDPKQARQEGEIRFDIPGGDYSHEQDRCTFETLLRLVPAPEPALRELAEIVHEIDLKDGKFQRPDAAGIQRVVLGIVLGSPQDEQRLRRGWDLFDNLLASFRRRAPGTGTG